MSSHKSRKIIRHLISLVFSFLLALCLASIMLLVGCMLGLFNDSVILRQLEKTEYYESVNQAINENVEELLMPSGLPQDIMDGLIDEKQVRTDAYNAFRSALNGDGYIADTYDLKERFDANIEKYINKNNIEVGSATKEGISELYEEIQKEYSRCLKFPFARYFVRYRNAFYKVFTPALAIFIILSVLICSLLVKIQHWKHRGVRYICYSTLAATLMLAVPTIWLIVSGIYYRINISPKYMYDLIVGIFGADLRILLFTACSGIVAFVAELIVIYKMREQLRQKGGHFE